MANNINITFSKADMGLENVDNTSDLNKPISTATQTALDDKVDKEAGSRLITSAEAALLADTSGTNTGDQNLQSVVTAGNTTDTNIQFGTGVGVLLNNNSKLKEGTIDAGYGGTKGIAQICAVGYELKWEAGRLYVMGDGGTIIREVSHNFTTTPNNYDDLSKGFILGSRWILDNGDIYICTEPKLDEATWELQTIGNQTLQQVTDNGDTTTNSIYVPKVYLNDEVNNNYGSLHYTDGNFHIEDADGHKLLVIEDGFLQLHQTDLIQSNLWLSDLTETRDHYLPDQSGTIALTTDIPSVDSVPTDGSNEAVSSNGVFDALADKVDKEAGSRLITSAESTLLGNTSGTNTGDETVTTIKTKLGITTLSGSNTGDQDLSGYQATLTATNLKTLVDTFVATTTPVDADVVPITNSAGTTTKKLSWSNFKSTLLAYFDTIFPRVTAATTGSVISFNVPVVWNTPASPSSSNLTDDLTGAKIGYIQKIYHNKATAPTVPAGWVLIGTGTYTTSTLNIIFAEWVSSTRVEYWITKPQ